MESVKLNENHWLVRRPLKTNEERASVHHIWIIDVSMSMRDMIGEMAKDIIGHIGTLEFGDMLSVAWFSTYGMYDFFIRSLRIEGADSILEATRAIANNMYCRALTSFSGPLGEAVEIADKTEWDGVTSLTFFTDGYPVVSGISEQEEYDLIFGHLGKLSMVLDHSMLVGYGKYYNRDLMLRMSSIAGGSLIHSSSLGEFSGPMRSHIQSSRSFMRMVDAYGDICFTIEDGVKRHRAVRKQFLVPSTAGEVYFISDRPHGNIIALHSAEFIGAIYAAALIFYRMDRGDVAMEILAKCQDPYMYNKVYNSWTLEEMGQTDTALQYASSRRSGRWIDGIAEIKGPDKGSLCVLDVMFLLATNNCKFVPYTDGFHYNRIGPRTKRLGGYPDFIADDTSFDIRNLVWSQKRLNLSISTTVSGHVRLEMPNPLERDRYETRMYRSYTVIQDGFLSMREIPVQLNESAFDYLRSFELIDGEYDSEKVYLVPLYKLPLINGWISEIDLRARDLFETYWNLLVTKAELKVLKSYLPEQKADESLSDEQNKFLELIGIKSYGYSPKTEKEVADVYEAHTFEIKAKGFSSLPAVDAVREKLYTGGKLTPRERLIGDAIQRYRSFPTEGVKEQIDLLKTSKFLSESDIAQAKFAILVCKRWFGDLDRKDPRMTIDGVEYTIDIRKVQVEI